MRVKEGQGFHREGHWPLARMRLQTWLRRRKDTQRSNSNNKGTVLFLALHVIGDKRRVSQKSRDIVFSSSANDSLDYIQYTGSSSCFQNDDSQSLQT